MPEDLGDLREAGAIHGEARGRGVPEVVEAEVLDSCALESLLPCAPEVGYRVSVRSREDAIRIDSPYLGMLAQQVQRVPYEGHATAFPVFRPVELMRR